MHIAACGHGLAFHARHQHLHAGRGIAHVVFGVVEVADLPWHRHGSEQLHAGQGMAMRACTSAKAFDVTGERQGGFCAVHQGQHVHQVRAVTALVLAVCSLQCEHRLAGGVDRANDGVL